MDKEIQSFQFIFTGQQYFSKEKIGMLILEHTYFNILRVTLTVG